MLNGGSAKTRSIEPVVDPREQLQAVSLVQSIELERRDVRRRGTIRARRAARRRPRSTGCRCTRSCTGGPARRVRARRTAVAVAVAVGRRPRVGLVDAVLGELLVQGVAVDAEAGGGLDLDAVAGLEDLLDQLALDLADDPVVQVVGVRAGGADALADQLGGQGGEVAAAAAADRPGGGLAAELRGQVLDGQLGARRPGSPPARRSSAARGRCPASRARGAAASPRGGPAAPRGGSARRSA